MAWDVLGGKLVAGSWQRDAGDGQMEGWKLEQAKRLARKVPWKPIVAVGLGLLLAPRLITAFERRSERKAARRKYHEGWPHEETVVDIRRPTTAQLFAKGFPGRKRAA